MSVPRTQSPTPARAFTQRFSATRRGARLARLLAAHQLTEWGHPHGTEAHDTVILVVAELAANAAAASRDGTSPCPCPTTRAVASSGSR